MTDQIIKLNSNFKEQSNLTRWPNTQYGRYYAKTIHDKDNNILYYIYLSVAGVQNSDMTLRILLYFESDLMSCFNNNYRIGAYKDFDFCSKHEREEAFKIANALSDKLKPFLENNFIDKLFTKDMCIQLIDKLGFRKIR